MDRRARRGHRELDFSAYLTLVTNNGESRQMATESRHQRNHPNSEVSRDLWGNRNKRNFT